MVSKRPKLRPDECYEWQLRFEVRCWRCRVLVSQLNRLKKKGILLEKGCQIIECAQEGCSTAPWVGTKYCQDHLLGALSSGVHTIEYVEKRLRCMRESRKKRDMARFADSYLRTGFQIEEPADMLAFFQTGELDTISLSTETLLDLILDGDEDILLVDTEFVGWFLLQISIRNARGKLLYKKTVDHGITVKELCEKAVAQTGPFNFILGNIHKFHGPPSLKLTGESKDTSTLTEIFAYLEEHGIIQPGHKILEWSMNRCDYRYLCAAAEKAGFMHLMPPVENSFCCILSLRKSMPGLFSFSLPILFYMIDPNSPLIMRAHVADEDTLIFTIVEIIFGLMYYGRKDEFLIYWEKYRDNSEGWTKFFMEDWEKNPVKSRSDGPIMAPSAVSSTKRRLESARNSKASKKAKTSDNSKSQPKAKAQPTKSKALTKKVASESGPLKPSPKSLTIAKKQGPTFVQDPSSDQQKTSLPTARQSSRTKGKLPQYREGSDGDDSNGSVFTEDEADDEST